MVTEDSSAPELSWLGEATAVEGPRGTMQLGTSGMCVCNHVLGHLDVAMGEALLARCDALIRERRKVRVFCHWGEMTGYDPEVRALCTDWGMKNRGAVVGYHMLMRDRIVQLGVEVAAVVLRRVQSYSSAEDFLRAHARFAA